MFGAVLDVLIISSEIFPPPRRYLVFGGVYGPISGLVFQLIMVLVLLSAVAQVNFTCWPKLTFCDIGG